MKVRLLFLILLIFLFAHAHLCADLEEYFLQEVRIRGNSVTKEQYVRSFITLEEGKRYDLDGIITEINISRDNLLKTGLFSDIFFNDEVDERDNLIITVQLKEKNYFLFGPTGYIVYERQKIRSEAGLFMEYTNLFGKAGTFYLEIPLYENVGFLLTYRGGAGTVRFTAEAEYQYSLKENDEYAQYTPGISYRFSSDLLLGFDLSLNDGTHTSSIFQPFLEIGKKERYSYKVKKWMYSRISPYYGIDFSSGSFYGAAAQIRFYRDLLLKIIYNVYIKADIQDGDIPENLALRVDVRGTFPEDRIGNKRFSFINELHVPLPWAGSIVIVPFVDTNLLGDNRLEFFLGGGLGVHWFTRYQDPLITEIAFGKGVMLNLRKRF